ncbi:fructose transport system substrate-binding protein [Limimaricola variabilis]|uniref:Fructose transport system substrate-binding protein n=1 Tax=Limimaricola variabilis TaxID=1492771 RepID=A0ABR6HR96_9RHOB|nr:substrate-binding domain-containing protein [Limimaricola variabilis]MBB3713055.1 fructose transport system substrate-binding protein [Limimaricola variabilis]
MNIKKTVARTAAAALSLGILASSASAQEPIIVGLITKTASNAFFAKMDEGAQAEADRLGVELRSFAGKFDGDNETQIAAIENLIAAGASGILIVASDTKAIVPSIERARAAGILVIALDTPLDPAEAADATFATDNVMAGRLIGQWAAGTLGDAAETTKVAFLDALENQPTVDVARDQGFMMGFGIDAKDPSRYLDEDDPRIVGHRWGQGSEEGGRTGMEMLLQQAPDLGVVYTINEPTAAGAFEALKAAGVQDDVLITSVDGGCPGVRDVQAGVIGATAMQFPLKMAALGVEAVVEFARTGEKPTPTEGLDFFDTGVKLVTDAPVEGVPSITSEEALEECWG